MCGRLKTKTMRMQHNAATNLGNVTFWCHNQGCTHVAPGKCMAPLGTNKCWTAWGTAMMPWPTPISAFYSPTWCISATCEHLSKWRQHSVSPWCPIQKWVTQWMKLLGSYYQSQSGNAWFETGLIGGSKMWILNFEAAINRWNSCGSHLFICATHPMRCLAMAPRESMDVGTWAPTGAAPKRINAGGLVRRCGTCRSQFP